MTLNVIEHQWFTKIKNISIRTYTTSTCRYIYSYYKETADCAYECSASVVVNIWEAFVGRRSECTNPLIFAPFSSGENVMTGIALVCRRVTHSNSFLNHEKQEQFRTLRNSLRKLSFNQPYSTGFEHAELRTNMWQITNTRFMSMPLFLKIWN